MLVKSLLSKKLTTIVLAFALSAMVVLIGTKEANALTVGKTLITNVSPSPYQTTQIAGNEQPLHNLILSEHGRVQSVQVGMYFPTNVNNTFRVNISSVCIMDPPGSYGLANPYLYVEIGSGPFTEGINRWRVTGNQACNGWLDTKTFVIPSGDMVANAQGTGLHRARVNIRWVSNTDTGAPAGIRNTIAAVNNGEGSRMRFRFVASSGGKVGYLDTSGTSTTVTNNSLVHTAPNTYEPFIFPFGLPCNAAGSAPNEIVSLYDADNGQASQFGNQTVYFYVATLNGDTNSDGKVDATDGNPIVVPLQRGEYTNLAGNGPASSLSDIWVNEYPPNAPERTRDNVNRNLRDYATADSPGNYSYPIFTPSNFNNEGGVTSVKVHSVQKDKNYVLVVKNVHANQFVYVGLPSDALFGSPDFNCPAAITPVVNLTGSYEEGTNIDAEAYVSNTLPTAGSADWQRDFWYEGGGDDSPGGIGDINIPPSPRTGTNQTFNPGVTTAPFPVWPEIIEPGRTRICTKLTLRNPAPGTTIAPPGFDIACVNVIKKPYLHVYSGDVQAGAVFEGLGSGCAASPVSGFINTYNQGISGAGGAYAGSGTHIAAFAYGAIDQFTSASFKAAGAGGKPKGLSFANTALDTYGGNSLMVSCITDYWNGNTTLPLDKRLNDIIPGTLTPGYVIPGLGPSSTIFVNGTLHIDRNITFGAWTGDIKNAPTQWFVVKGNITIDPAVTRLAGVYVALPKDDGTQGKIYTCAPTAFTAPSAFDMRNGGPCGSNLRVDGAFIARQIKFTRIKGSVGAATVNEGPPAQQAESFLFNPLVWINLPSDINFGGTDPYDSILNLPPVL